MDRPLSELFRRYPSSLSPIDEPLPLGNAGGLSGARLWRYRSGQGPALVRAWPVDGTPRPAIEVIHGWLLGLDSLPFIPRPFPALDGRTLHEVDGLPWQIDPFLPGRPVADDPPSASHLRAAFSALAAFHVRLALHASHGPSPNLRSRLQEIQEWRSAGFSALQSWLDREPSTPLTLAARQWLRDAQSLAPRVLDDLSRTAGLALPKQPCLRDVRPDHFLFESDRVTGLVDFGAMGVDTIAGDLARLLSEWCPRDPVLRSVALDAYSDIRPLDVREVALIPVFERSAALLGGGHWLRWRVFEAKPFHDPDAPTLGVEKSVRRMQSWLSA